MALLFVFAAVLQLNDPDPIRWIAVYGAAGAVCFIAVFSRRVPFFAALMLGLVAVAWAAQIALGGPAVSEYSRMFDAWEMKSPSVEEAREASGLILVAAWMTVLVVRGLRTAPSQA